LTELVAGTAQLGSCVYRFEDGRIDIIPSGQLPPNPTELFSSLRFKQTLSILAERYDRIILDSAPCQAVSDTLLLSRHVDAVIFLTRSDSTPRKQVGNAVRSLRRAQAPMLGVILNQVDIRKAADFDGGYYYKYGYYG
jgi:capsular exopolysaccharide synthesis family protein